MTTLSPRPMPNALAPAATVTERSHRISALPVLILFPHSRCNCRCLMCDIWRSTGRDQVEVPEVRAWVSEWKALGVERVVLSGGEALLHHDLWALCDVLRDAGIGISILSTGLLLARHATDLVKRCDDVVVSLDGPQALHDGIRNVPRAYERLAEGILALRSTGADLTISARCTVQRANFHSLRATVRAAHQLSLDRISFLAVDVSSAAFNRPEGWSGERVSGVALTADQLPALDSELDALERDHAGDFQNGFIAESPDKLRQRIAVYFRGLLGLGEFAANRCNAPWVSTVIEADGTVRPCFFQPALGNLRQSGGLEAVINSDDAIAWRAGLDISRNEICRKCVCTLSLDERR